MSSTNSAFAVFMALRSTLLRIAALVSTVSACSSSDDVDAPLASDGVASDAEADDASQPQCGGCGCGSPITRQGQASPDQACAILSETSLGAACVAFCGALPGNKYPVRYLQLPRFLGLQECPSQRAVRRGLERRRRHHLPRLEGRCRG